MHDFPNRKDAFTSFKETGNFCKISACRQLFLRNTFFLLYMYVASVNDTLIQSKCIQMSNTRSAWSSEEKEFLENYIREAGGVPSKESSLFWKSCAEMLSSHCGTSRTGKIHNLLYRSVRTLCLSLVITEYIPLLLIINVCISFQEKCVEVDIRR